MNELGQPKTFLKSISEFSRLFLNLKESGFLLYLSFLTLFMS